jgi:malonate transporter
MTIVVNALLPVFLTIALGAVLKRTLLPSEQAWNGIERLTYFVLFPVLLMVTTGTADISGIPAREMTLALLVPFLLVTAILLLTNTLLVRVYEMSGPSFTSVFQTSTRWNSYITLAIASALYGINGLALVAVALIALIPLINAVNVWVLAHYASNEKLTARELAVQIIRNPMVWSCLIGMAINLAHLPLPKFLIAYGELLGRSSLTLGLLLVGAGLEIGDAWKLNGPITVALILKLILTPVVAIALALWLGLSGAPLAIVAVVASVPTAPASYILARQMGGDAPLIARILTLQTILALITITVSLAVVGALHT